jgi:NAD(P)-dependent dehydrogenase (short-subunit alcohol dehydrogenase family)
MERLLEDKVAIVTGAAQGIGCAIAETMAEHGAKVVVADLQLARARAVAEGIAASTPSGAIAVHADVSDSDSVASMVQATLEEFQQIDVLVNNAAILRPYLVVDLPEEAWDATFAVNAKGVFLCSQAVVRQMIAQGGGGAIVNIASCAGKKADSQHAAYASSKAAVMAFTRVLALEVGPHNIRVNGINPGATNTEMLRDVCAAVPGLFERLKDRTVLGRIAQPRDQANVAVFLASDLAAHITGETLVVSGGEMMTQ